MAEKMQQIIWSFEPQLPLWNIGVNFTKILRAAFRRKDPKSAKKTVKLAMQLFAFLGSACVKAACKHGDETDLWLTYRQS